MYYIGHQKDSEKQFNAAARSLNNSVNRDKRTALCKFGKRVCFK